MDRRCQECLSSTHHYVAPHHMKSFMLSRHCGRYGFQVLPEQTIDLIHNVAKFIISICRRQFELHNEPVHLVDADGDGHTLLYSMFNQTLCIQHHLGRHTQSSGLYERLKNADVCSDSAVVGEDQREIKISNSLLLLRRWRGQHHLRSGC